MSYSILIENSPPKEQLECVLPRRRHLWVDDNSVTVCSSCKSSFSIFLRRHHCRLCGKIFCYACSDKRMQIPEQLVTTQTETSWNDYLLYYLSEETTQHRVCTPCSELIDRIHQVTKVINMFNILQLDIFELKQAGNVCKVWQYASNYCLSLFREIQYKLPTEVLTPVEIQLLWVNSKYFAGHSRYLISLLKACRTDDDMFKLQTLLTAPQTTTCMSLMCTRSCSKTISAMDSINLLAYCFRTKNLLPTLIKTITTNLICTDREFKCYLPFLVFHLRHDTGILSNYLLKRCLDNVELLNALYWELMFYYRRVNCEPVYVTLVDNMKQLFAQAQNIGKFTCISKSHAFMEIILKIGNAICLEKLSYEEIKHSYLLTEPLINPLTTNKIIDVQLDKIKIKDSFSRPVIIPCVSPSNITELMFKRDNLRKDQVVINLITLVDIIVQRECSVDLGIVTYNILPIDTTCGIIQIVDEADTIYYIQEKLQMSILNYILEQNGKYKIDELRSRFIKSTAAYSVITYLLGVGDRHLDNIMITRDGRLFHIDFGYILGTDPVFNNPNIRITPEIVEAVGGFNSVYYKEFTDLCTMIFNCLRRNIDIFMNMLLFLADTKDVTLSEDEIKRQILKRFLPGETDIDARFHIVTKLEQRSYTDRIKDFCHYHNKENTLGAGVSLLTTAFGTWT